VNVKLVSLGIGFKDALHQPWELLVGVHVGEGGVGGVGGVAQTLLALHASPALQLVAQHSSPRLPQ